MTLISQSKAAQRPALDHTGKAVLDDIYGQNDPRPYFRALKPLDYIIPQVAHDYFRAIEAHLSETRQKDRLGIVDVGCSYGINGALLKLGLSYDALVENYTNEAYGDFGREALISRDRGLFSGDLNQGPIVTGVDISRPALRYGLDAGFIDERLESNLESREIADADQKRLAGKDLVISTGCVGYVKGATLCRLIDGIENATRVNSSIGAGLSKGTRPWSAHFVLRMFDYDEIARDVEKRGYETIAISGLFKQRKFISFDEQVQIVDKLAADEIDTRGLEAEGWFYARLYLSIPEEDMDDAGPLISRLNLMADS